MIPLSKHLDELVFYMQGFWTQYSVSYQEFHSPTVPCSTLLGMSSWRQP